MTIGSVPVVLLVHRVADVRAGDVDARCGPDLNGFLEPADLHGDVLADRLAALEQDPELVTAFLNPVMSTVTEYRPRTSGGRRVRAGAVRHDDGVDARRFVVDRDGRAGNAAPCASVTTPLMTALSARCARRGVLEQTLKQRVAARTREAYR